MPKVLHPLAGFPIIWYVEHLAIALSPAKITFVISDDLKQYFANSPHRIITQPYQGGTGHAVQSALENSGELQEYRTLVLYGDTPLLLQSQVQELLNINSDMAIMTFHAPLPNGYGRVILDSNNNAKEIIEFKDLPPSEQANDSIPLNAGIMAFAGGVLPKYLPSLSKNNQQGELYLTDIVSLTNSGGGLVKHLSVPKTSVFGINTQAELQTAENILQERLLRQHQENGVIAGQNVVFTADTKISSGCMIEPFVVFGRNVTLENGVVIRSFSHLTECTIKKNATIGPFARIRPKTVVGEDCHIGNFVELKAAKLGRNVKAGHLSYLGDTTIGDNCNVGAGTITCNYDGMNKHQTTIGNDVFVGSNTALVAPINIGDTAYIGAGSVITTSVPADTLAVTRAPTKIINNWSKRNKKINGTKHDNS